MSFTVSLPRNGSEEKSHSSVSSEDTSCSTSSDSSEEAGSSEDQEAGDEEWEWEEEEAKATVTGAAGTAKQVSSKQDCAETDGPVLTHLQETFNVLSGAYKIITGRSSK